MKLLRIKAIAKKELIQIRRDPLSLAIAFLMPVMQLFIYGYAITYDVDNLTTIVYDQDRSQLSRELVAQFEQSGYFRILAYVDHDDDIDAYLGQSHHHDSAAVRAGCRNRKRRAGWYYY